MFKIDALNTDASVSIYPGGAPARAGVIRLTPSQWRVILESHGFLERPDNCFQHPRRFQGARVQIIPDESFR